MSGLDVLRAVERPAWGPSTLALHHHHADRAAGWPSCAEAARAVAAAVTHDKLVAKFKPELEDYAFDDTKLWSAAPGYREWCRVQRWERAKSGVECSASTPPGLAT